MLAQQRRDIESATNAVLSDQYGFTEGAGNASQCEHFVYHEDFEYGVLECHEREELNSNETRGRVVATGFASPGFPLLRYDVGDSGVWASDHFRCLCGRSSRVLLSIDGRNDDYVITPEGRRIMRFDYLFKDTPSIREAQVVQETLGEIVIRVVLEHDRTTELEVIRDLVKQWISPKLSVRFEVVTDLPKGENGKLKAVVSLLRPEASEGRTLG
jgi:phenylacetate-CoA ligase